MNFPGKVPWPEWSESVFAEEKWDNPKGDGDELYEDPHYRFIPSSLKPHSWKRFKQIQSQPVVYVPSTNSPNLFVNNQHLLHSEIMRWFISSFTILHYYGQDGLDLKEKNENQQWQGWKHVYSVGKSGKSSKHDPQINPHGKYIIRLFFMNCWRRFEVDDLVPVDEEDNLLLPQTENPNELWPILLTKALLKIASLSCCSNHEVHNFNPFTSLMGWSCISLNVSHLSPKNRWELLINCNKNCKQSFEMGNDDGEKLGSEELIQSWRSENLTRTKSKDSGKIEKEGIRGNDLLPVVTLLQLENGKIDDKLPELFFGYPIYVESICDTPSDLTLIKPPLKRWKLHRWLPWAMRHGIIDSKEYFTPTRRIRLLTSFLEVGNSDNEPIWTDFNKISHFPMDFHFLYNREDFEFSAVISNILPDDSKPEIRRESSLKKIPDNSSISKTERRFHYQPLARNRNEPLYLFVDSIKTIFFLFDFSVFQEYSEEQEKTVSHKIISSLLVDKHCWFNRSIDDKHLLEIRTIGSTSKVLCLQPGRHLLKIFCQSQDLYSLIISSDTEFHVGDRKEVYDIMTSESERIQVFSKNIESCLINVLNSFGTSMHQADLKNYFQSYLPEKSSNSSDTDFREIHNLFKEELGKILRKKFLEDSTSEIVEALRILFIDPTIGVEISCPDSQDSINNELISAPSSSLDNSEEDSGQNENNQQHNDKINKAAVVIQSLFRMMRIKFYKNVHQVNHEKHETIKSTLRKIVLLLDGELISDVVRNMIKRNSRMKILYPWSSDLEKVLQIQKICGKSRNSYNSWIPITRLFLEVPENQVVFAAIDLFSDLPFHNLRVFNNDNEREIQRIVHNVVPFHYQKNKSGYTVLSYGWNDQQTMKENEWILQITKMKGDPQFVEFSKQEVSSSLIQIPIPEIKELSNIYIPNILNYILKAIIDIPESCSASIRLKTSFKKVKMLLRIFNKDQQVLTEVSGTFCLFLPIINFEKEGHYFIEAFVLESTWPLTEEEWLVVEEAKKDSTQLFKPAEKKSRKSSSSSEKPSKKRKVSRKSSKHFLESPRWLLQVMHNPQIDMKIFEDRSRQLEIAELKETWKLNDPNRFKRGGELREEFIKSNSLETDTISDSKSFEEMILNDHLENDSRTSHEEEEFRTLLPPKNRLKLVPLDVAPFLETINDNKRVIKTESSERIQRNSREAKISEFNRTLANFSDKSYKILQESSLAAINSAKSSTSRTR